VSVELPLKDKYLNVTKGKVKQRAAGGGNSTKKHPNKHLAGAGLRIEGELKKQAMAQTMANRRALVFHDGRKYWLLLDLYNQLQKDGKLHEYLEGR
jgi:hypothetical protein